MIRRTFTFVLAAAVASGIFGWSRTYGDTTSPITPRSCEESDPCWDPSQCHTNGNKLCAGDLDWLIQVGTAADTALTPAEQELCKNRQMVNCWVEISADGRRDVYGLPWTLESVPTT